MCAGVGSYSLIDDEEGELPNKPEGSAFDNDEEPVKNQAEIIE
jgi:hypothetical protein